MSWLREEDQYGYMYITYYMVYAGFHTGARRGAGISPLPSKSSPPEFKDLKVNVAVYKDLNIEFVTKRFLARERSVRMQLSHIAHDYLSQDS